MCEGVARISRLDYPLKTAKGRKSVDDAAVVATGVADTFDRFEHIMIVFHLLIVPAVCAEYRSARGLTISSRPYRNVYPDLNQI